MENSPAPEVMVSEHEEGEGHLRGNHTTGGWSSELVASQLGVYLNCLES